MNRYTTDEIVQRGQERYEREIRFKVEPEHQGKMLALDVDTGNYELGDDSLTALAGLKSKDPGAVIYIVRVGFPTAVKIGAGRKTADRA